MTCPRAWLLSFSLGRDVELSLGRDVETGRSGFDIPGRREG
jgi:hypothetical protein